MMSQIILSGLTEDQLREMVFQCVFKAIDLKGVSCDPKEKLEENYLTRKEVANLLRISLPTLHDWTKEGILISHRIGKRVLYKLVEIEKALSQGGFKKFRRGGANAA